MFILIYNQRVHFRRNNFIWCFTTITIFITLKNMVYFRSTTRAQFHGSAYRRILRLRSRFPAYVQAPNFCASLVSVECLITWSTQAQKSKFAANPWNTLAVSTEFPAYVSADSVLTVSRAMNLGPVSSLGASPHHAYNNKIQVLGHWSCKKIINK